MRQHTALAVAAATISFAACNVPESSFGNSCFSLDFGCQNTRGAEFYVVGFPFDKVNAVSGVYEMVPGDHATLYFISGSFGLFGAVDTVRTVKWGVTDPAVARITAGQGGSGLLVAVAPGTFSVTIDGQGPWLWACAPTQCTNITSMRVVAPPAPAVSPNRNPQ